MDIFEMFDTDNNKLKYQGKPMIRRVHLLKARNKRINKDTIGYKFSIAFIDLAASSRKTASSFSEFAKAIEEYCEKEMM